MTIGMAEEAIAPSAGNNRTYSDERCKENKCGGC